MTTWCPHLAVDERKDSFNDGVCLCRIKDRLVRACPLPPLLLHGLQRPQSQRECRIHADDVVVLQILDSGMWWSDSSQVTMARQRKRTCACRARKALSDDTWSGLSAGPRTSAQTSAVLPSQPYVSRDFADRALPLTIFDAKVME